MHPGQWPRWVQRIGRLACLLFTINLIAACAVNTRTTGQNDNKNDINRVISGPITGRISLLVQSEPVQSFAGSFELLGSADTGSLTLLTPLGSTAAVLRWSPGLAQLDDGSKSQNYPSVAAMMLRTTGAAVPIEALFAWLRGQTAEVTGWQANLSRYREGRISAQRNDPAPPAQLRIALDQ
jgi:outer membrane lipoprotein LolB